MSTDYLSDCLCWYFFLGSILRASMGIWFSLLKYTSLHWAGHRLNQKYFTVWLWKGHNAENHGNWFYYPQKWKFDYIWSCLKCSVVPKCDSAPVLRPSAFTHGHSVSVRSTAPSLCWLCVCHFGFCCCLSPFCCSVSIGGHGLGKKLYEWMFMFLDFLDSWAWTIRAVVSTFLFPLLKSGFPLGLTNGLMYSMVEWHFGYC